MPKGYLLPRLSALQYNTYSKPFLFSCEFPLQTNDKTIIALYNYGGGLRGLIPAHIMSRIEETTGLRMSDMIDIFAGPSTGAILNAAITLPHADNPLRPRYRARHLVRFYEREGANIFPQDRHRELRGMIHDFNNRTLKISQMKDLVKHGHYDPKNLGRALKALYGDAKITDSLRTLIVPTYNIDGKARLHLKNKGDHSYTNDNQSSAILNPEYGGQSIWFKNICAPLLKPENEILPTVSTYDAVMASCAAPTYFPCHNMTVKYPNSDPITMAGIDGCIFDNPCISYMGAIRRMIPKDHNLIMIVLGTGSTNRPLSGDEWNRYGSLGIVDPVNDLPLINIFFHSSESALTDDFNFELGNNLFVLNKSILNSPDFPSPQIDDASPENFKRMRDFHELIIEENKASFERMCDMLVTHYEGKLTKPAKTPFFSRFFKRIGY
jgi:predicted acylesterase/phospholipase RssA